MNEDSFVLIKELLDRHEAGTKERHQEALREITEVKTHLTAVEARLHALEITVAGNAPVIRGVTGATVLLAAALVSGYVGSLLGG